MTGWIHWTPKVFGFVCFSLIGIVVVALAVLIVLVLDQVLHLWDWTEDDLEEACRGRDPLEKRRRYR